MKSINPRKSVIQISYNSAKVHSGELKLGQIPACSQGNANGGTAFILKIAPFLK